jgi:hypothetical protein
MKESDWLDIAGWVSRLWPNDPIRPDTAVAWMPFVADLEFDDVRGAIATLRQDASQRFAPTPGDIRAVIEGPPADGWMVDARRAQRSLADRSGTWRRTAGPVATAWIELCGGISTVRAEGLGFHNAANRAHFRDFWRDWHRQRTTERRAEVAAGALPELTTGDVR